MKRKLIIAILLTFLFNILPQGAVCAEVVLTVDRDSHYLLSEGMAFSFDSSECFSFNERVQLSASQKPIKIEDNTYLPYRFVMENCKAIVKYEEKTGKIFVEYGINIIEAQSGNNTFYFDDKDIVVKDGIVFKEGTAFISTDALTKVFGFYVSEKNEYIYVGYEEPNEELFEEMDRLYSIERKDNLEFYVSKDGDDDNDGSKDAPFKTIQKAKKVIRIWLRENEQDRDIVVYLREGKYNLSEQILFNQKDSAENLFQIKYTNYENEKVSVAGSKPVDGWELYKGNMYRAYVGKDLRIDMLYENGQMLTKARHPNYNNENSVLGHIQNVGFLTQKQDRVKFNNGDFPHIYNTEDLEINIWGRNAKMWFNHTIDVFEIDYENNILCIDEHVFENTDIGSIYFLQGTIELLDIDGEYCYDSKAGYLYVIPNGYTMEGKSFAIPTSDNVIKFGGESDKKTVKNISIENMEIMNTHRSDDVSTATGGTGNGSGVMLSFCENITVKNCDIHDVGDDGVYLINYVKNCKIQNNSLRNLGGGGVTSISQERRKIVIDQALALGYNDYQGLHRFSRVKYNLVENNLINRCGIITGHASGIDFVHNDSGWNYVQFNKIYDVRRMGINWGYSADRDYVRYNDVSNVMNGTEDGGMFYSLFEPVDRGVAVINNYFHDSVANYGTCGIYHDENSNGIFTKNNLLESLGLYGDTVLGHTPSLGPLQFVKSKGGQVINNIYANCPDANCPDSKYAVLLSNSNNKPWNESITVKNNVLYNVGDEGVNIMAYTDSALMLVLQSSRRQTIMLMLPSIIL